MDTSPPLRLTVLEDDESAVELLRALLAADGLDCLVQHVYDEPGYRAALSEPLPDVILSDYNLPTIDGMRALQIRNELCRTTPFILVSGAVGEAVAISLLKSGLTDFVLKDELPRLVPAIRRSVAEAREHQERVTAQQSLRDSEARYRRLAENAPDVIFRFNFQAGRWRCDFMSAAIERITGYRAEEFYGNSFLPLRVVHPDDREIIEALMVHRRVPPAAAEIRWLTRDGRTIVTDQRFVPVYNERDEVVAIEGIARDVTQERAEEDRRRTLEMQLNQAQKMESIGTLAGGIAHDFNNILTGILGFAELAQIEVGRFGTVSDSLAEIRKAGLRARDLVAQILTFCRQQQSQPVPLDLSRVVGDAVRFLRSSSPATIAIERRLDRCTVRGDPTQIHQVILNLCTNALHAMEGRTGTLTVEIETVAVGPDLAATTLPKMLPGRYARLLVRDTGHGMDEKVRAQIFDPFFTTKPVGVGTGIGLSVVHGIVATHAGGITVESVVGQGTTFLVYFPVCEQVNENIEAVRSAPRGQGQCLLLIDDDFAVGRFASARLQQLGYQPSVFADPRLALEAVRAAPGRFAAMLTDLTMPGMTGVDLVREIRRVAPQMPAAIMSGNRTGLSGVKDLAGVELINKPFSGEDLGELVHRLLQRSGSKP